MDLNNNESLVSGVFPNHNGTFTIGLQKMLIILDERYNEVEIIPDHFSYEEAITAAKDAVCEAAREGKTLLAVNEDGESVLPPSLFTPEKNSGVYVF
ncbi:TPA: DUF1391 domain-containing protein [Salmonella enterica]|nr:DUF1391 domain-containing protein [Salmonella enterica]